MTKTLVVISGKGGTGKTSVTASFALLASNAVIADGDVDAADLHLILDPTTREKAPFTAGVIASIDRERCTACGACREACVYHAIDESFVIDPIACEGCGLCQWICPADAVVLTPNACGRSFISDTRAGPFVHARLDPGAENSGKLVSFVRGKAAELAEEKKLVIVDGPPGIGCPVIAAIGGTDLALIVTEPSAAAFEDLKRIADTAAHFDVPVVCAINRYDISTELTARIEAYLAERSIPLIGRIPYDEAFFAAQLAGKAIVEADKGPAATEIRRMWKNIEDRLGME